MLFYRFGDDTQYHAVPVGHDTSRLDEGDACFKKDMSAQGTPIIGFSNKLQCLAAVFPDYIIHAPEYNSRCQRNPAVYVIYFIDFDKKGHNRAVFGKSVAPVGKTSLNKIGVSLAAD